MESSGGNEVTMSMRDEANCSETTIEIKIKTLDSQTYTLQVDKCLPVPALKEQIASVTGVLSEQQRLICRGKVLKDDQLLSAYHVEDGHTLHMVVRQSIPPLSEVSPDHAAAEQAMNNGHQGGPSVVVGTVNISEQGGVLPDLSRIVSAVLGSFGITNVGSVNEGADIRGAGPDRVSRNASGQQTDQAPSTGQSNNHHGASSFTSVPLEHVQPTVITDSLTTLSQYLTRLRDEFSANDYTVRGRSYDVQSTDTLASAGQQSDAARPRLLSPEALAEVMVSARQLLVNQAADCLSRLTQQLEDHVNVTDSMSRSNIQRNVERSGVLLQSLGAALLELGRTATTLRMGPRPVDADVSSNPAVFISDSALNPIIVQQLAFQTGASFGVLPVGTPQTASGISGGSLGSGFLPRNIDIRIRTGPLNSSPGTVPQPPVANNPPASGDGQTSAGAPVNPSFIRVSDARPLRTLVPQSPVANNPPASGDGQTGAGAPVNSSSVRVSEARPLRTVVAALPASIRRLPSDSSRGSVGLFYPVLARVQHVRLSNQGDNQASNETVEHWNGQFPDINSGETVQGRDIPEPNASTPSVDGAQIGQGFQNGLDQLLRSIFPGEHIHVNDINIQRVNSSSGVAYAEPAWGTAFAEPGARANAQGTTQGDVTAQEATPRAGAEGLFLSNLLRQIMPIISENSASGSAQEGTAAEASTAQDEDNSNRGTTSRQRDDSESESSSKRQKTE